MSINTSLSQKTLKELEAISGETLTLSGLLHAIREGEHMSQTAFAQLLKVSRQYICDIEHRRRYVSPKAAYQYAQILGYSPEQFVRLALQDELDNANIPYTVEVCDAA